jgi:hypothetical protein
MWIAWQLACTNRRFQQGEATNFTLIVPWSFQRENTDLIVQSRYPTNSVTKLSMTTSENGSVSRTEFCKDTSPSVHRCASTLLAHEQPERRKKNFNGCAHIDILTMAK